MGCLRFYKDDINAKGNCEVKPIKIVQIDYLPRSGIEAILAHPLMSKRYYPYVVVKVNSRVNVIRTRGILNASEEKEDYEKSAYTTPRARNPLLVVHYDY